MRLRSASPELTDAGTDFPAVTVDTAAWYTNNVARFYESRPDRHAAVVRDNALALIPSLA